MSIFRESRHACPRCGVPVRGQIALSVNAARSPSLRKALLTGRLHRFDCPACRAPFVVESPLHYIDFARRQWIFAFPAAWEPEWPTHEAKARETTRLAAGEGSPGGGKLAEGLRVRAVFGLAALREKVICLDADLDDAALEALKLEALRSMPALTLHPDVRPRLNEVTADHLHFLLRHPDKATEQVALTLPRAACAAMRASPQHAELIRRLQAGLYVDIGREMFGGAPAASASP